MWTTFRPGIKAQQQGHWNVALSGNPQYSTDRAGRCGRRWKIRDETGSIFLSKTEFAHGNTPGQASSLSIIGSGDLCAVSSNCSTWSNRAKSIYASFMLRRPKAPPFPFVVEALAPLHPDIRPMFSGFCVYVGDKAVLMLRESAKIPQDNGVWIIFADKRDADTDNSDALRHRFSSIRTIGLLGGKISHWLLLPSDAGDFESCALTACDLLLAHDPRIGRVPESRKVGHPRKSGRRS
jgi:hypothetical protein